MVDAEMVELVCDDTPVANQDVTVAVSGCVFDAQPPTEAGGNCRGDTKVLDASNPSILRSEIGPNEIQLYRSPEQHLNWLDCIKTRELSIAQAEIGHRSCSACLLAHIAMQVDRKLYWDPQRERFINDDEANTRLSRPQRYPYGTDYIKGALDPDAA